MWVALTEASLEVRSSGEFVLADAAYDGSNRESSVQ